MLAFRALSLWLLASQLTFSTWTPYARAEETRHPVSFEDLQSVNEMMYVNLSADGKWLAYGISGHDEIWMASTVFGGPPTVVDKGSFARWSPDSQHLAYYGSKNGVTQLFVYDRLSGKTESVTDLKGGVDPSLPSGFIGFSHVGLDENGLFFSWSPDSQKIVFSSQVSVGSKPADEKAAAADGTPLILTNDTPPLWTIAGIFVGRSTVPRLQNGAVGTSDPEMSRHPNQLFIVDVKTKRTTQVTTDEAEYFAPDWSPDGQEIVCLSMEGRPFSGFGSGPTNLYLIDVATGKKVALTTDVKYYKHLPKWSPDGRWIAYFREDAPRSGHLVILSLKQGDTTDLTDVDHIPFGYEWSPDSKYLYFMRNELCGVELDRTAIATRETRTVVERYGMRFLIGVSRSGTVYWHQSDPSTPAAVHALASGARSSIEVLDVNPEVKHWQMGAEEVVHWTNHRGDYLEGILLKPVGYRAGHRYPLIVDCYPGTVNSFLGYGMHGNQMMANQGYMVFFPVRRSPHTWMNAEDELAFDKAAAGPKGIDVMVDDILTGVDELVRQGLVDENRMGLTGFSNGGGVVNQLVTRTSRFKCAVSVSGAMSTDWTANFLLATLWKYIPPLAGSLPWEDPQRWVELSAVYRLDKVHTPMLIAAGDREVPVADIELYNGLRYLGRDVTFLRYPTQGHGFHGVALKDFVQRRQQFLDKYLHPLE